MANSLIFTVTCVFILFCSSALANRTYFLFNETLALAAASNADGICQEMVQSRGYICEEHKVTTKDGYVLSLQRIPLGRAGGQKGNRVPVLLQHGLLMVSDLFHHTHILMFTFSFFFCLIFNISDELGRYNMAVEPTRSVIGFGVS